MTIITLTTDFGSGDYEAGVLKGVIWNIAPSVEIADLTHDIAPHDILQAALVLWCSARYFPDGTIHVAVVDPGVGTNRRGIAACIEKQYFIGPDNGIFSLVAKRADEHGQQKSFHHLANPQYWLPEVTTVFHGRDIFSPVAAHLANGVNLAEFGPQIFDSIQIDIPEPITTPEGWIGQVIHVDHFGNLSTNLTTSNLLGDGKYTISINATQISDIVSTFGERVSGTLVALFDSSGSLAICVVNGSAAQLLNAHPGDEVLVERKR